ncbi:MAG: arginine deiminase-related protein [Desulfovibrionales bacterium]|nr:arginine deiminase-related protein [Desulfovibrionales bacterium]
MLDVSRTTDTILMVRPYDFGFNEETGMDNEFQQRPTESEEEINKKANLEFQTMVDRLRAEGVTVLILEKPKKAYDRTPDAIFPNNWFSTEHDGTLLTYPMAAMNRRRERRPEDVEKLLKANGYKIRNVINVGSLDETEKFLEGTGSMIIDHRAEVVYAARSNRCDEDQFDNFIRLRFYEEGIIFDTQSSKGTPIYHTNVMMSIGDRYAVACLECIPDAHQRSGVKKSLEASFDLIEISMDQMENYFCGNILQVNSAGGRPLIVMSQTAHDGFSDDQRSRLEKYGTLLPMELSTIESIGGGSARCMMAEIFSEKK